MDDSLRGHAESILALLDAGVTDELTAANARISDLEARIDRTSQSSRTIRHDLPADESAAAVAHEAMSVHRLLHARPGYPRWEDALPDHVAEMIAQVRSIRAGEITTAQQSHEAWMTRAKTAGWRYAPGYSSVDLTDPSIRPWSELLESDQENRRLLIAVVRTLSEKR